MKRFLPALLLALSSAVYAAEDANQPIYLDPASAGQDYADQGEYTNSWGGAQVIALGNGTFRMVTYPGGLPGAGWNQNSKTETPGKREGEKVVFSGENGYHAELAEGKISIRTADGGPWTMEKTVRQSPTLGARPPADAVVLFDGSSADAWNGGHMNAQHWLAAGCKSKQHFTNFTAHIEFYLPFKPLARGQARANSGVYLQDRYEVQVLDSFGLKGLDNECGAIYSQTAPAVNLCYPPLTWQTYDVGFTAAHFDDGGKKTKDAVVSLRQNGVTVLDQVSLKGPTPGGRPETPAGGPLQLQGHGNPVFFRNIWVVPSP
jgi:3-keto-disaccharide hydrolase